MNNYYHVDFEVNYLECYSFVDFETRDWDVDGLKL